MLKRFTKTLHHLNKFFIAIIVCNFSYIKSRSTLLIPHNKKTNLKNEIFNNFCSYWQCHGKYSASKFSPLPKSCQKCPQGFTTWSTSSSWTWSSSINLKPSLYSNYLWKMWKDCAQCRRKGILLNFIKPEKLLFI